MLSEVKTFEFSREALNDAYACLKQVGLNQYEAVALFAGVVKSDTAKITTSIIPKQTTIRSEEGLMYQVEGSELHRINIWLYKNKLELIAQIHSHPTDAYHSDTDDECAIITEIGGLSIVVPNFARGILQPLVWAFYRLSASGEWIELSEKEVEKLVKVV
jgi:hypothetical protein